MELTDTVALLTGANRESGAAIVSALAAADARSWLRADRGPIPAVILFAPFLSVVPGRRGRRTPVRAIGPARAGPEVSALRQNRQIWRDATDHANKPTGEQNGGYARGLFGNSTTYRDR